jgi:hypothetical protein
MDTLADYCIHMQRRNALGGLPGSATGLGHTLQVSLG